MTTTAAIDALLLRISENLKPIDVDSAYDEMLDDCYSFEKVGGPFAYMSASSVLKECDPTAYRCGKNDWVDSQEWVEVGDDYYDQREVESERDDYVSDLESELEDLEADLAEADDEEDRSQDYCDKLQCEIEAKQAAIAEVQKYIF